MDWAANMDAERALAHDARALVQRLNLMLAANQIADASVQRIVDILERGTWMPDPPSDAARRWRVIAAITLVMSSVEYLVQK